MTSSTTARYLATIDRLRADALPAQRGSGCRVADLRVSEEFWDADLTRVEEVGEEFEAELLVLVHVLSLRWGAPEVLDLTDHLERSAMGEPVPPPLDTLCGYVPELHTWRVDGRWVALGVGQGDRELPLQLVVAIAEDPGPGAEPR
ncbi:hypothetical protein [Streptomyces sp. NPDC048636]|uniref:hypothetical protein n=1 Tax=Streptomyces sp. NPDC048636 TaxID=3155762 RepID=UPI003437CC11